MGVRCRPCSPPLAVQPGSAQISYLTSKQLARTPRCNPWPASRSQLPSLKLAAPCQGLASATGWWHLLLLCLGKQLRLQIFGPWSFYPLSTSAWASKGNLPERDLGPYRWGYRWGKGSSPLKSSFSLMVTAFPSPSAKQGCWWSGAPRGVGCHFQIAGLHWWGYAHIQTRTSPLGTSTKGLRIPFPVTPSLFSLQLP